MNKEKNFISAVVYVNNNQDTIKYFLIQLNSTLKETFEKYEIICVNDASDDGSVSKIQEFSNDIDECVVSIINMSYYQGLETSMNAGVDLAIGDFVFEFDDDYIDYDLSTITDIYFRSLEGYDIVAAANTKRKFFSNLFYKLYNRSANTQYKLNSETFRILSRRAINRIHSMSKTIPYRKAIYSNCGLQIDTTIYAPTKAKINKSQTKNNSKHRQDTAFNTLILFTNVAYKISMFMTVLMLLATFSSAIYTVVIFLLGKPVAGYTTTMLVITLSFFGVFAILAMIIKYLSIIIDLIFKEQKYVVESIEKITK